MKKQLKRTIYMIIIAVLLFSASMAIPVLYYSKAREYVQGASFGLMLAAVVSIGIMIYNNLIKDKTT